MSVANQGIAKSAWAELMAEHGHASDATLHNSRHTMLDHVTDLTTSVADIYVTTAIIDTMLDVPGSGLNLFGTELPTDDGEGLAATAGLASGLLGSIFSA